MNSPLFTIKTGPITVEWSLLKHSSSAALSRDIDTGGTLQIKPSPAYFSTFTVCRSGFPPTTDMSIQYGPYLFEETDYMVMLSASDDSAVSLSNRDPSLLQERRQLPGSSNFIATLNFRSQVGYSDFTVLIDGRPVFTFTVEVFPSKLEYKEDYEQMLAEVQEILTGLAMEYLRATYHLGQTDPNPNPSGLEWLILLRSIAAELECALQQIARHPLRGMRRDRKITRIERIRRIDSSLRSTIVRGGGHGAFSQVEGLPIRRMLPEHRTETNLDTPEHRWLALQITRICQRLAQLRREEANKELTVRRKKILEELDCLEVRMRKLANLEPLAAAEGNPPAGFSSLQLQCAPGYREAFQKSIVLMLGLRIDGGPIGLSAKDVSLLYEYWCFIALLKLIEQETGARIPVKALFHIQQQGLAVMLTHGRTTAVPFDLLGGRKLIAEYNPKYAREPILINQNPDIVLTLEAPLWPPQKLILDAKYRIDTSPEYIKTYKSSGPPEDAINVLHRYRDAILELKSDSIGNACPKRSVVQAAALFPNRYKKPGQFKESRLWMALEKIGIGAVPLLPGSTEYLSEWLQKTLKQGGWSIAERAIRNVADDRMHDWRQAATEAVLVATLRDSNPQDHYDWISNNGMYYIPIKTTQPRFHELRWVAIYLPAELRRPGAIVMWARIKGMEVKKRKEIVTPWSAKRHPDEQMFLYHLDKLKPLDQPVINEDKEGKGSRLGSHRWTTRLGLLRARNLTELFLETEPEWRLYESLKAEGIIFSIQAGKVKGTDPLDPTGRAWFIINDKKVQYRGSSGFIIRWADNSHKYLSAPQQIIVKTTVSKIL